MNNRTIGTLSAFALAFSAASMAQSPENQTESYERDSTSKQERASTPQTRTEAQRRAEQMGHSGSTMQDMHQATQLTAGQITADQLTSASVTIRDDDSVGTVTDLVIDSDGKVSAVLVSVGEVLGIGGDTKALSWDDFQIMHKDDGEVDLRITMTEAQLNNLPDFDSDWEARTPRLGSTD